MRKFVLLLAALGTATGASAQVIDCGDGSLEQIFLDDGVAESCWKIGNPSGPSDWFNVDFDLLAANREVAGVVAMFCETQPAGVIGELGFYPDNLLVDPTGATPDVSAPLSNLVHPTGLPGTFCSDFIAYDTPDVTLASASGVHVAHLSEPADSAVWLCADTSAPFSNKSYFSSDAYATPAVPFTVNWMLRIGAVPEDVVDGYFTIDGKTATIVEQLTDVVFTLWAPVTGTPWLLMFDASGIGAGPFLGPFPSAVLLTNDDPVSGAGSLCGQIGCRAIPGETYTFITIWADLTDTKPNGKPKIKLSNTANFGLKRAPICEPGGWGIQDDGVLDGSISKVGNPAGPLDYFNVNFGTNALSTVSTLTGVEVASWDFSGTGAAWDEVGIYAANLGVDGSGNTPNVATPVAALASPAIPAGQSDWAFPATFYDTPDVASNSTTIYHGGVKWPTGDSVIWVAADSDGLDVDAAYRSDASFFTSDGYATPAIGPSSNAWMLRLHWN